jgi:hypothetical protein
MVLFLLYDIEKSYLNAGMLVRHRHFFPIVSCLCSASVFRRQGSVRYCWSRISPALPTVQLCFRYSEKVNRRSRAPTPPPSYKHGGILHAHLSSTVLIVKNCYTNIETRTSYIAKQKDMFLFQCPSLQNHIRSKNFFPCIYIIIVTIHHTYRSKTKNFFAVHVQIVHTV